MPLVPGVVPRIWIGNRITVQTHFDLMENIGVCLAGRRRFTLFPPEQLPNLYAGPFELTPAGTPISLVDPLAPDLERYPRFAEAWAHARQAELEPGDAVYIPYAWWHGVEALEPLSILVNYWWKGALGTVDRTSSGMDCLIHGLLNLKPRPAELRQAWAALFDHYVFRPSESDVEHIPRHRRGVLAELSPEAARRLRNLLIARLQA
jgi:hypothetical protein